MDVCVCVCVSLTVREGRTSDLLKRRATKQVLIRRMPRLFVLHLKRFQQTARGLSKLGTDVRFGVTLDVSPFCEPGRAPPAPVYRLSGVVEHAGGLSSGALPRHSVSLAMLTYAYRRSLHSVHTQRRQVGVLLGRALAPRVRVAGARRRGVPTVL